MAGGHHRGELARDVDPGGVADPRGGGVLAGEDGAGVDGLALGEHEREGLVERLGRAQPLEGGGGGGGGVHDEDGGVAGEGDDQVLALDGVRVGEGEGERAAGLGVEDGDEGEGAGVEGEGAGVRGGEGEEGGGVDGGGREVEVEGEVDVGGEGVAGVGEGVGVDGRHWRRRMVAEVRVSGRDEEES